jgi:hypothetical protein
VKLALGTTMDFWHKPKTLSLSEEFEFIQVADVLESVFYQFLDLIWLSGNLEKSFIDGAA